MKKILIILMFLAVQITFGQDSTRFLISSKPIKVRVKFYAGTGIESSFVNQKAIYSSPIDFGLQFNKKFFVGIFFANSLNATTRIIQDNAMANQEYRFYQGGVQTGYIFKPHKALHFVASSKVGVLSVDYKNINGLIEEFSNALYFLPQINAEMNLTRHLRFSLGAGYRITNRKEEFFKQNQANGLVYQVNFSFGRFYK
jgi:hypothetical protein